MSVWDYSWKKLFLFLIKVSRFWWILFKRRYFDTWLLQMNTVKVLHSIRVSSLRSTKFNGISVWDYLWKKCFLFLIKIGHICWILFKRRKFDTWSFQKYILKLLHSVCASSLIRTKSNGISVWDYLRKNCYFLLLIKIGQICWILFKRRNFDTWAPTQRYDNT